MWFQKDSYKDSYKVFISYERLDAGFAAGFIYRELMGYYDSGVVFRDVEETRTGTDWQPRLLRLISDCDAFVVIIGHDWNGPRMIEKLNDPTNWVHKEIVAAVDAEKQIFPVVLERASVPTAIPVKLSRALNLHQLQFRQDIRFWRDDIERLCTHIEAATGLKWTRSQASGTLGQLDRVLCRLDRHKQLGSAQQEFSDGHNLFLACGKKKAGFRYFALRCAAEVAEASSGDTPQATRLDWGVFSGAADASTRETILMKKIAQTVFAVPQLEIERAAHEKWLINRIQTNTRPIVVFCTVPRGMAEAGLIQEWFTVWDRLLKNDDGHARTRSIAVMLFLEAGLWPWSWSAAQWKDCGGCIVRDPLNKIRRHDLEQWLGAEVQQYADERLVRRVKEVGQSLYRFHRGRHFDDIGEVMQDVWS